MAGVGGVGGPNEQNKQKLIKLEKFKDPVVERRKPEFEIKKPVNGEYRSISGLNSQVPPRMEAFTSDECANMLAEIRNSQGQPNSLFGGNRNVIPPNNALYEMELAVAKEKDMEAAETAKEKGVPNNEEDRTGQLKKAFDYEYDKQKILEMMEKMDKMDKMEQERLKAEATKEAKNAYEAAKVQPKKDIKNMYGLGD